MSGNLRYFYDLEEFNPILCIISSKYDWLSNERPAKPVVLPKRILSELSVQVLIQGNDWKYYTKRPSQMLLQQFLLLDFPEIQSIFHTVRLSILLRFL